jgi:hypothetical protein
MERSEKSLRDLRGDERRRRVLKRILIALVVLAIAAFCVVYLIRNPFKAPAPKQEALNRGARTESVSVELVKKYKALDAWDRELCGNEPARITPILTMELEKLWLTDQPILFVGKIIDIKSEDNANYRLTVDRDLYLAAALGRPVLSTDLRISVLCPKSMIESFVKNNPDFLEADNGIGVIAKIDAIEALGKSTDVGAERGSGKVGTGKGLDLVCLRNR